MTLADIASLATAIALVFLAAQLYLQNKDQKSQAIAQLFDEMETVDFRRMMTYLYWHKSEDLVAECVKRLRQLVAEFRVELNCLDRRSRLLSGVQAVELWTTLCCAPSCPQAPPRRLRRLTRRSVWAD
jgi:hypothetical protein